MSRAFHMACSHPVVATLLLGLFVSACGPAGAGSGDTPDRSTVGVSVKSPAPSAAVVASHPVDARVLYAADLTRAVMGAKGVPFTASVAIGDMACVPASIAGTNAASRRFTLMLPEDSRTRTHVLAVVTPERGLLEVYSPYEENEAEDVIVPSDAISWRKARTQRRFSVDSAQLDGLSLNRDTPEPLFLEAGRYRFVLVNGIDAALLKANGARVEVLAACSIDWTP